MRVTIDYYTEQVIDELLKACIGCEFRVAGRCTTPYKTRKDVIRSALQKFGEMDCTPDEEEKREVTK